MKPNLYVTVRDSVTGELEGYSTSNGENHIVLNDKMVELNYEANIGKLTPRVRDEYILWAGALVALPPRLYDFQRMNYVTRQWFDPRTLADFKAQQWTLIKQARTTAEYAGFTWGGSTFDSDQISQARITGAVTLAQMSSAFTIDWTLKDNTVRTLGQADMIAVGVALGAHVQTQFAKGQALRAQIEAATDQAGVEAVVW